MDILIHKILSIFTIGRLRRMIKLNKIPDSWHEFQNSWEFLENSGKLVTLIL